MRITVTTSDTALTFMRRAGYGFQKETSGEVAFVRRVGGGMFPRYHAYVIEAASRQPQAASGKRELQINIHVDQKVPTYERGRAHSGEYEGSLVEEEAARLREIAQASASSQKDGGEKPTPGGPPEGEKGFWKRLFS